MTTKIDNNSDSLGQIVGKMKGKSKTETNYNYCNPLCRQLVSDLIAENKYLKTIINDFRKDKQFLISLFIDRNDFADEIRGEFEKLNTLIDKRDQK